MNLSLLPPHQPPQAIDEAALRRFGEAVEVTSSRFVSLQWPLRVGTALETA